MWGRRSYFLTLEDIVLCASPNMNAPHQIWTIESICNVRPRLAPALGYVSVTLRVYVTFKVQSYLQLFAHFLLLNLILT